MLSAPARRRALTEILRGPLTIGLGYSIADDGGLYEVDDPAYTPQAIVMGPPEDDAGEVVSTNTGEVAFEPFANDAESEVRFWYIGDADGGIVATGMLEPLPDGSWIKPYAGWAMRFGPGDVRIGLRP